jgi:hypothetical protein
MINVDPNYIRKAFKIFIIMPAESKVRQGHIHYGYRSVTNAFNKNEILKYLSLPIDDPRT